MRIEVLVGSEDPVIHPLKSPKLLVGSSESCDVVVTAGGISRKHLLIQSEGDQYFVTDQGSTNGSFMNEERLVPGKRIEFTSFFPVRLGENVLISLLSDDEGFEAAPEKSQASKTDLSSPNLAATKKSGATSTIRYESANPSAAIKQKLDKAEANRSSAGVKAPPPRRKVEKKSNTLSIIAVLLVIGAAYYNFFIAPPEDAGDEEIAQVGEVIKPIEEPNPAGPEVNLDLVKDVELPKKESFSNLINDLKCTNDVERYLCDAIPGAREGTFGVVQVGLTYNVLINADQFIGEARDKLLNPNWNDPADVRRYMDDLYVVAAYIFLRSRLPLLDEKILGPDSKIAVGLYKMVEQGPEIEKVIAFYPKVFNREKPNLDEGRLLYVKKAGIQSLEPFQKFFRVY